jgi:hypothetical protein
MFEDWDFLVRIFRLGDYAFVDDVIVRYRRHPGQMTNHVYGMAMDEFVRAKTLKSSLNSRDQLKAVRRAWRGAEVRFSFDMGKVMFRELKKGRLIPACGALMQVITHAARFIVGPVGVRIPRRTDLAAFISST